MQAIEFEATTFHHTIRVPDHVPDGVLLRILLLVDDEKIDNAGDTDQNWKNLLASMPDVGRDEDFSRPDDKNRQAALAHIAAVRVDWQGKPIPDSDALYEDQKCK